MTMSKESVFPVVEQNLFYVVARGEWTPDTYRLDWMPHFKSLTVWLSTNEISQISQDFCVLFSRWSTHSCLHFNIWYRMLKPKVLHQVLSQANTAGVRATMYVSLRLASFIITIYHMALSNIKILCMWSSLLNSEGSLLASAGEDHDIASAIFANIWASFAKCDSSIDFLLSEQEVSTFLHLSLLVLAAQYLKQASKLLFLNRISLLTSVNL